MFKNRSEGKQQCLYRHGGNVEGNLLTVNNVESLHSLLIGIGENGRRDGAAQCHTTYRCIGCFNRRVPSKQVRGAPAAANGGKEQFDYIAAQRKLFFDGWS